MNSTERRHVMRLLDAIVDGAAARGMPRNKRQAARVLQQESHEWLNEPGVQGIGIGRKITNELETEETGVRLYVEKKKPKSALEAAAPEELVLADETVFPVDVVPIGKLEVHENIERKRPLTAGYSIANTRRSPGTLGLFVRSIEDASTPYILGAYHVLAPPSDSSTTQVTQPALADLGDAGPEVVAEYWNSIPITFNQDGFPNFADAAIARVLAGQSVNSSIPSIGTPADYSGIFRRGQNVRIVGRTTGYGVGKIIDTNFNMTLDYDGSDGSTWFAGFKSQVLCSQYGSPGDSGCAVLNSNGHVIGLHVAGSSSVSVFSPISPIMRFFNLELW